MSVASEYTEDGGNEQLTLQQPESTGSLPKYTVTFDRETKLGMLLERRAAFTPGATSEQKKARPEQTVVTMVIEGGAAAQKGVAVGSRLLLINGQDATALPYARCLELVKSLPRPLHLVFEKSMAACDSAKGWVLVKKSAGSGPPSSMAGWQRMFFVVGGAVAKRHVLQLYSSKAQYEDIVVRMFQGQPLTGMKYKACAERDVQVLGDPVQGVQGRAPAGQVLRAAEPLLADEDDEVRLAEPVHRRRAPQPRHALRDEGLAFGVPFPALLTSSPCSLSRCGYGSIQPAS